AVRAIVIVVAGERFGLREGSHRRECDQNDFHIFSIADRLRKLVSVMVTRVEPLHAVEVRVLGALIEKDITTPEYYPLTANSLQNACNQKSSRDPVVQFDEQTVEQALEMLQNKHLVVRISGTGHRVEKWGHKL